MTVSRMLSEMSSSELTEWIALADMRANPNKKPQSTTEMRSVLKALGRKKGK